MCYSLLVLSLDPYSRSDFTGMDRFYKNNCINRCSDQKVVGPLQHQKKETVIIIMEA